MTLEKRSLITTSILWIVMVISMEIVSRTPDQSIYEIMFGLLSFFSFLGACGMTVFLVFVWLENAETKPKKQKEKYFE